MKKRILVLLSVVALMVVMLATAVGSAFAAPPQYSCRNPETGGVFEPLSHKEAKRFEKLGAECHKLPK